MSQSVNETSIFKIIMIALTLTIALPLVVALARRGGDDRSEFYGIVQVRPENRLQGAWVIGGRTFTADAGTEFDQLEGQLTVGSCDKVHMRDGRVHEIDSEPMRNCQ